MKKFIFTISALAFFASACFLSAGFATALPRGVIVNGRDVGGLSYSRATRALREDVEKQLKDKILKIYAGERIYEYSYPEIYYADCFDKWLKKIDKKGEFRLPVFYYLNGADKICDYVCESVEKEVVEPYAVFNYEGEPFTYYEGGDGVRADREKLIKDVSKALNGGDGEVRVALENVERKKDISAVRNSTVKLYSFTTYFDSSNVERCANIKLAAGKINGAVIPAGECFSFNQTVGARTPENGYKPAKIIEDGKFVLGVGGGVCQVSTTLYNAVLLAGLSIAEYHPHSLPVSYVAPSRDAMVSGSYCDLKFVNNRNTPIYVRMKCTASSICCTVYGESDGFDYSFQSKVVGIIPKAEEEIVEGDDDRVLSFGKDGLESEGYLIKERDGERAESLIRKDKYAPIAPVRQVRKNAP